MKLAIPGNPNDAQAKTSAIVARRGVTAHNPPMRPISLV